MKKKLLFALSMVAILVCLFAISVSAAAPAPAKPDLGVDFGAVSTIDGFTAPSELFVGTTERVLLVDENGAYVTYPTYYVTKNNTTFDFDFSKLNAAQSIQYTKKSVVMVEIPSGVTAISNSYFSGTGNFPVCVSVQVPGTVTSYGSSVFATNTVIRVVEYLDGTVPVTMGDGMFGSNWSVGTTNLEYVRFPNNLVSIGNNTFGKSHANKTIIFGENFESFGTGFFGESTPSGKDTFLYVSDKFFANVDMFEKLFGGFDQYHNSMLRITLFYTGTQEQAQALVEKGMAAQAKYVWDNAKFVSAAEYSYDQHKVTANNSITIVYDYEKCDAFYGGHSWTGAEDVIVNSYFEAIGIGDSCGNCGKSDIRNTIAPIFEWKGYSACTFGESYAITQGYIINKEALELYKRYAGDIKIGVVATVNAEGGEVTVDFNAGNVFAYSMNEIKHDYIEIKASGIPETHKKTNVIFCAYMTVGGSTYYLDNNQSNKAVTGISYNEVLKLSGEVA